MQDTDSLPPPRNPRVRARSGNPDEAALSVGDADDNELGESCLDSSKTELIADRVWRSRARLELAIVVYLGWFDNAGLHASLGDLPPAEYEQLHAPREATTLVGANPVRLT